jgi:hypothetical protein
MIFAKGPLKTRIHLLKISTPFEIYLFRSLVDLGFRQLLAQSQSGMKGLFQSQPLKLKAQEAHLRFGPSALGVSFSQKSFGLKLASSFT